MKNLRCSTCFRDPCLCAEEDEAAEEIICAYLEEPYGGVISGGDVLEYVLEYVPRKEGKVVAVTCESCGHHEIGINNGKFIQLKPGMDITVDITI